MRQINFNIKDRKVLTLVLCLVLVSVFTLTVAYSALSAVLTISGSARVSAADWDIYLSNPRVTNGSVTTDVPEIKTSNTLEFSTTLNMPGDFYEFTVDVVNGGSIDAMISNVVKNPELSVEQAKFLKYEITYQNGEAISNQQLLAKESTMPIKVRIEYRNDLVASDLPSTSTTLDLSLTLEYVQSDGTGSSVNGNGQLIYADGYIYDVGTLVTIGSEQFYTIGDTSEGILLLARYNLQVGYSIDRNWDAIPITNPSGMQDSLARGDMYGYATFGTTEFANETYRGKEINSYEGSLVEMYVNNYKNEIEKMGIVVDDARLLTKEELTSGPFYCEEWRDCTSDAYPWITETAYWLGTDDGSENVWGINNSLSYNIYSLDDTYGVRPVIEISQDYFN